MDGDLQVQPQTEDVEIKLEGEGPWTFLGSDIDLVFTPGHTRYVNLHYCHHERQKYPQFFLEHVGNCIFSLSSVLIATGITKKFK